MPLSATVLDTATRWVAGAGAIAAFRAAAMRAKIAARFSGMLMTARKLAAQARRLNPDMPLVLFTDDTPRDWFAAARRLPRGGIVVIRGRTAKARAALFDRLRPLPLRFLIADDPLLAEEADGLHLPEARAREAAHWRAHRPGWIITASAHSLRALMRTSHLDAVFLSPVFATASHPGAPALTPARAALMAAQADVPVYALGGVTARNAVLLAPAFSGIAAITGLF
jgi:thiamine-phosphate pyrophosphorylase